MSRSIGRSFQPLLGSMAALAALWLAGPAFGQGPPTFSVGSDTYPMKRYPEMPDPAPAKRPVVVLVHGLDGLSGQSGKQIEGFARQLAGEGFLVLVPSYFGKDDGPDSDPFEVLLKRRVPKVKIYLARVTAAVGTALKLGDADGSRLGLIGFSLGGGLVLEYAESVPTGQVKAVVDFFGYISDGAILRNAGKLPPTLVLHNKNDQFVDLKYSKDLLDALETAHIKNDHHFYDDGDPLRGFHPFLAGGGDDKDSRSRAVTWLKLCLK